MGRPSLDPVQDMNIVDDAFKTLVRKKIETLETVLFSHALRSPALPRLYEQYARKRNLEERINTLRRQIRDTNAIAPLG